MEYESDTDRLDMLLKLLNAVDRLNTQELQQLELRIAIRLQELTR